MSRRWKAGLAVVAFVVALNVALAIIHSLTGGTPGGPDSSSYTTGPAGVAAYASLLGRAGHRVDRVRGRVATAHLDPNATAVLLDAGPVSRADATTLHGFVAAGGRLVVGGATGPWLERVVPGAPAWSPTPLGRVDRLAPSPELVQVGGVDAPGDGSWQGGGTLPLLGNSTGALVALGAVGAGRVLLLADTAPLQNRLLGRDDNARLGLDLAGPPRRPVLFLEGYHGYGAASGFAAVPSRWWAAFALLAFATLAAMLAYGRRFGPPQATERELPPPRRDYVDALAATLARTRPRGGAVEPVRERVRSLVLRASRLDEASPAGRIERAAVTLGLTEHEARAVLRPATNDADILALGRALARLEGESRS